MYYDVDVSVVVLSNISTHIHLKVHSNLIALAMFIVVLSSVGRLVEPVCLVYSSDFVDGAYFFNVFLLQSKHYNGVKLLKNSIIFVA